MKNKRIMSAAMAVLMAGSLAACGGSASSTADSTAAESTSTAASTEATAESTDEPVTIRITWWGGQTRHDLSLIHILLLYILARFLAVVGMFSSCRTTLSVALSLSW